jgi:hypothetical protein
MKYTMTCGGSFPPFRFAVLPVASTASSTASRGTQDASTPREIQSLNRSSATPPVCAITRDHPDTRHETAGRSQDQPKLSGIESWPDELRRAIMHSRILLPVLTPAYFTSPWNVAEWRTFEMRESVSDTPLIVPVALRSSERYPPYAQTRQFFNATEFPARTSDWTSDHLRNVRSLAEQIARMLERVPPFRPDFPDVEPEDITADSLQIPESPPRLL